MNTILEALKQLNEADFERSEAVHEMSFDEFKKATENGVVELYDEDLGDIVKFFPVGDGDMYLEKWATEGLINDSDAYDTSLESVEFFAVNDEFAAECIVVGSAEELYDAFQECINKIKDPEDVTIFQGDENWADIIEENDFYDTIDDQVAMIMGITLAK